MTVRAIQLRYRAAPLVVGMLMAGAPPLGCSSSQGPSADEGPRSTDASTATARRDAEPLADSAAPLDDVVTAQPGEDVSPSEPALDAASGPMPVPMPDATILTAGVTLYRDDALEPAKFAVGETRSALMRGGVSSNEAPLSAMSTAPPGAGSLRIVVAIATPELRATLQAQGGAAVSALKAQQFVIRHTAVGGVSWVWALGGDAAGAMYGGLELADTIRLNGVAQIKDLERSPFVENRGIKFNIPLDARTPSYSDTGEAAWNNVEVMWDVAFWHEFLDDLARYRYNTVSLWNLFPFPSMVKVPGFEDVSLADVKKNTVPFSSDLQGVGMVPQKVLDNAATVKTLSIEQKIAFWQDVMRYGKNRGIDFSVITWNLFTFTATGHDGITLSQTNPATVAYLRGAVHQMISTYPLLAGIGETAGEAMTEPKQTFLWNTYGQGILDAKKADPLRQVRFISRTVQTTIPDVTAAFSNYPDTLDFSVKYSQAHMLSSPAPHLVDALINGMPAGKRTWLEVRNDDMYLMRWGDPDYARAYVTGMPAPSKLAGFMMGPDGYVWGREFVSTDPDTPRQTIINKQWYSFMLWGRLSYDPTVPTSDFQKAVAQRFPGADGAAIYDAWTSVSKVLPLVTRFHWSADQLDYQWYPEGCMGRTFHDVDRFIADGTFPGENMVDITAYTAAVSSGKTVTGKTPLDVASELEMLGASALQKIGAIAAGTNKELQHTLGDITAMAYLGRYYGEKIAGATSLSLYRKSGNAADKTAAVAHLRTAATHWRAYAKQSTSQYKPQILTRVQGAPVDFNAFTAAVDNDIAIAQK